MSEDGLPDPLDDPPMEVTVETLTGTMFDIRVYPSETILDIKTRIQRVEGIPVHHQSLLYQMKEMGDYSMLSDYGITNGSTIKLVLTIRGGPISTRRFTSCDHQIIWRDLKELIENTPAVGNEPGRKVSVLVYKEGEVLNVLRVVENEDGSYSPYKGDNPLKTDDTMKGRKSSGSYSKKPDAKPSDMERKLTAAEYDLDYSPLGDFEPFLLPNKNLTVEQHQEDLNQLDTVLRQMSEDWKMQEKVERLRRHMRHVRTMKQVRQSRAATAAEDLALKEKHLASASTRSNFVQNLHVFDPPHARSEQVEKEFVQPSHNRMRMARVDLIMQEEETGITLEEPHQQELAACSPGQCKIGAYQRRTSLDYEGGDFALGSMVEPADETDDIFYRIPALPYTASTTPQCHPQSPCLTARSPLYGRLSHDSNDNILTPLAESPSPEVPERNLCNIERVQNDYVDYEDLEQDVFGYYSAEFDKYMASGIPPPTSLMAGSSGLDIATNYLRSMDENQQEEDFEATNLAGEIKKLTLRSDFQSQMVADTLPVLPPKPSVAAAKSACTSAIANLSDKRELPPVLTKKGMRCGQCNKRLNITNLYTCRCGRIFCSQHRYSEAHDCKYDYKTEGRKLIEQQNPLVTASKLTKF